MSEKKKRNVIIFTLCTVLLLMTIGYAAFNTFLNINGTTSITSNWDIRITNITSKAKEGDAYDIEEPSHTDLEATFKTGLKSPGDSITYDITVENKGTFNAYLEKITINKKDNPAIIFESSGLKENDELEPDTSKILTIKVTYDSDITEDPEDKSADFTVELDFGQTVPILDATPEISYKCPDTYTQSGTVGPDMKCTKTEYINATIPTDKCFVTQDGEFGKYVESSYDYNFNFTCPSGYSLCSKGTTAVNYCYKNNYTFAKVICPSNYVYVQNGDGPWTGTSYTCGHSSVPSVGYCIMRCNVNLSCPDGSSPLYYGDRNAQCRTTKTTAPQQVTIYTCPDGYRLEDKKCYKE